MTKKYISGRSKVISFSGLSTDRHLYLSVDQAEPNLGYPGEKNVIGLAGTYYKLVTLDTDNLYDRYWIPEAPQTYLNGLTIFDEDIAIIAGINSVSKLNFVGNSINATVDATGTISTITVFAPGDPGNFVYTRPNNRNNKDFYATSFLYYDYANSRVGIASTLPAVGFYVNDEVDFVLVYLITKVILVILDQS
jgi:hypothetical protein